MGKTTSKMRLKEMGRIAFNQILAGADRHSVLMDLTAKGGDLALFEFGQAERSYNLRIRKTTTNTTRRAA